MTDGGKAMKIVVTGALGHIGSHLVRDLPGLIPGVEIVMIDNLMTQRYPSLFGLPADTRYRFVEADITKIDLAPLLAGAHAVVHLAAITDATGSIDKAPQVEANNLEATRRVAEASATAGTRMIALSSTSVYGSQETTVDEECPSEDLKPQSPYAETKLKEERLVQGLARDSGLRAIVFRFGTIFGVSPGMRFHTAVNKFCWQAVMGQPVTVWRTAFDQMRPYLDLRDAARAIAFAIAEDLFDGRVYNALTLNATVREIVEAIRAVVPELEVTFVDNRIMNQLSYQVSSARFRERGFSFAGVLERGVAETVALLRAANHG